jgi:hypothetical protein
MVHPWARNLTGNKEDYYYLDRARRLMPRGNKRRSPNPKAGFSVRGKVFFGRVLDLLVILSALPTADKSSPFSPEMKTSQSSSLNEGVGFWVRVGV